MLAYIAAALWAGLILVAMTGWGGIVCRILRPRLQAEWPQRAAFGFAFTAVVGGLLDLLALISAPLIVGYVAVGAAELAYRARRSRPDIAGYAARARHQGWLVRAAVAAASVLLVIRVAGSLIVVKAGGAPGNFNPADDFPAYMVFPLKMIQTGSMGPDPFSIRRTPTHAYGGGAFLEALVVSVLPAQSLRLLDVGLGSLLAVALLCNLAARLKVEANAALLLVLVFLLVPPPLVNTTPVLVPLALFLSLFLLFLRPDAELAKPSLGFLIGLEAAALGVLKTSLIPAAAAIVGIRGLILILRSDSRGRAAATVAQWIGFASLAALPWMLDAYRSTGTALPSGLAAYHADPLRVAAMREVTGLGRLPAHLRDLPLLPYVVLMALSALLMFRRPGRQVGHALWSLVAAAVIGSAAVTLAVGGAVNDLYRFMYAFTMAALLVAMGCMASAWAGLDGSVSRRLPVPVLLIAAVALVLPGRRRTVRMYDASLRNAAGAVRGGVLVPSRDATRYRTMQEAMEPGAVVLELTHRPFLFDFRRNTVLVDDMPGSASEAPGMPLFQGSDALADYLDRCGIRYIAFGYADVKGTVGTAMLARLAGDARYPSAQAVARLTLDMRKQILNLAHRYRRVYDDGRTLVLDLDAPRPIDQARPATDSKPTPKIAHSE